MYEIILASESPRRKEIMELMGIPFKIISSNVEEVVEEKTPVEMVQALAKLKAKGVEDLIIKEIKEDEEVIIIGADTMVFYKEEALGKPKDSEDAIRMLQLLSDDVHEVYTGVSIIIRKAGTEREHILLAVGTKVYVQALTMEQIKDYVATGEPMDKAGAYGIQGQFGIYIKEIVGDYYNVVGFPIAKIYNTLLGYGIDMKNIK